jgi:hypothetical protein
MVDLRAPAVWVAALASFAGACGGRSVSVDGRDRDDPSLGGANPQGGVSSGGVPHGGDGMGATGGTSFGGGGGVGGTPATGGAAANGGAVVGGDGGTAGDVCPSGVFTTIVGTVRDPAGEAPLYNVLVYVPDGPPAPIPEGIECASCRPMVPPPLSAALTDTTGRFSLVAPRGVSVPVVVQTGKWRREINVGPMRPCVENEVPDALLRLPRSRTEGHLPRIAVVTGREDSPECLLRRFGIADREFTTDAGSGAVNLFVGCGSNSGSGADHFAPALGGAEFPAYSELLSDPAKLARYDIVLMGCEGVACEEGKQAYQANVEGYANGGGRLFLNHLQNHWIRNASADLRATSVFSEISGLPLQELSLTVDQTFPKGAAFAQWLVNVGASDTMGTVIVRDAGASLREAVPPAFRWLYAPGDEPGLGVFTTTVSTPIAVPESERCGRITFMDFHAWTPEGDQSRSDIGFPDGCRTGWLSPQEAAFVFQLFDFASCVQSEGSRPPVPPGP